MELFIIKPRTVEPAELLPGERTITVHADRRAGECYRFWTVGNCNRPHFFLDPKFRENMKFRTPFVREANLVYLLGGRVQGHNEWFLGVGPNGEPRTDFSGLVAQLRAVIDAGYVPRIVLDNVPFKMSDSPTDNTYGNTAPPADERIWHRYVEAAVQAMVEAFGYETVASWWFRVGTEPDLYPHHWAGTREQYLAHYDFTADAVTRVLPEAKIGPGNILNPAEQEYREVDWEQWGLDIIDHCAVGTNACTGRTGTPMRVFSWSWYGVVGVPINVFDHAAEKVLERLRRYPQLGEVALEIGEFAVLVDEAGRRIYSGETTEWSASFYAALADRVYSYGIRQMYEWSETTAGILHPRTQVIALLDRMAGGDRVAVDVQGQSAASCGAVACRQGEKLLLLVYNHRDLRQPKVTERVHLVVRDPRMASGAAWQLSAWTVDETHGVWAYAFAADCEAAGLKPLPAAGFYEGSVTELYGEPGLEVFQRNRDKYARMSVTPCPRDRETVTGDNDRLAIDLEMPGHSVQLIELSPAT